MTAALTATPGTATGSVATIGFVAISIAAFHASHSCHDSIVTLSSRSHSVLLCAVNAWLVQYNIGGCQLDLGLKYHHYSSSRLQQLVTTHSACNNGCFCSGGPLAAPHQCLQTAHQALPDS